MTDLALEKALMENRELEARLEAMIDKSPDYEHLEQAAELLTEELLATHESPADFSMRIAKQRAWYERGLASIPAPPSEAPASPVEEGETVTETTVAGLALAQRAELNEWREWGMGLCPPPITCDADMREHIGNKAESTGWFEQQHARSQKKLFAARDGWDKALARLRAQVTERDRLETAGGMLYDQLMLWHGSDDWEPGDEQACSGWLVALRSQQTPTGEAEDSSSSPGATDASTDSGAAKPQEAGRFRAAPDSPGDDAGLPSTRLYGGTAMPVAPTSLSREALASARLDGETVPIEPVATTAEGERCNCMWPAAPRGRNHGVRCPAYRFSDAGEPSPTSLFATAGDAGGFVHGQRVVINKDARSRWAGCTGRVAQLHQLRVVVQLTDSIRDSFGYDELSAWQEEASPPPAAPGPVELVIAAARDMVAAVIDEQNGPGRWVALYEKLDELARRGGVKP